MHTILISRDKRVRNLFRDSWVNCLERNSFNCIHLYTGQKLYLKIYFTFKNLLQLYNSDKVLVFGLQDILFFKFFLFFHHVLKRLLSVIKLFKLR